MHIVPLIYAVLGGVITWALIEVWIRWSASRGAARALEQARRPGASTRLEPECYFVVRLTDSEVVCERPDGKVERVAWADLQKVEVVTTSEGPFVPDVFWVLHGTDAGCAIPQGATGERQLMERLQALPGFDNKTLIDAMVSTSDRRFLCWQKAA